jgi:NtrC-family two-component system response regulator AlgB
LRELRNTIERATVFTPAPVLNAEDLGLPEHECATERVELGGDVSLEAVEREHIACIIARADSLDAAARTLGIDATTLQRKRKRYGLA